MTVPSSTNHVASRSLVAVLAGGLVTCFLIFYLLTTHYQVTMDAGDAAQFQTIGVVGGVPHQPYPLWCLLSNCFALLPLGEPAFRVTLLSILCASLAVGLLFLLILEITRDNFASAIAAAAFGLSHAFWLTAVVAEVYSLNTLLQVVFLLLLLHWLRTFAASSWCLMLLSAGFLVSHHQLNIALFPPLALLFYQNRVAIRKHVSAGRVAAGAALFLFPFTLYLYTFIVSGNPGTLNWYENEGKWVYAHRGFDPSGFGHFWEKLRFQMWPARYGEMVQPPAELVRRAFFWIRHLVSLEFPFAGPLVMTVGFLSLWRLDRRMRVFWIVFVLTDAGLALNYLSGGGLTYIYSIPIFVVLSLCLAWGIASVRNALGAGRRRATIVTVLLGALLITMPVLRHVKTSPFARVLRSEAGVQEVESGEGFFWHLVASGDKGREYGHSVQSAVPPNSLIFARWAEGNVLFYHKLVTGLLEGTDVYYVLPRPEYMLGVIREKKPGEVFFAFRPDSLGFKTSEVLQIEPGRQMYRVDLTDILATH